MLKSPTISVCASVSADGNWGGGGLCCVGFEVVSV
jgi:hypothetical protein